MTAVQGPRSVSGPDPGSAGPDPVPACDIRGSSAVPGPRLPRSTCRAAHDALRAGVVVIGSAIAGASVRVIVSATPALDLQRRHLVVPALLLQVANIPEPLGAAAEAAILVDRDIDVTEGADRRDLVVHVVGHGVEAFAGRHAKVLA